MAVRGGGAGGAGRSLLNLNRPRQKIPTSLEHVQKCGYSVRVVYIVNPHIIFIERLARHGNSEDNRLSQIGLEYVLPCSATYSEAFDKMTTTLSCQWTPGSIKISREFIREAKEIYYIPSLEGDVYKVFDNVPCTLGKLYLLRSDNNLEELSEMLSKYTTTVYYSIEIFKSLYLAKNLISKPSETIISKLKHELKEYMKVQKILNDEYSNSYNPNSEEEMKKMCGEILEAKKSFFVRFYKKIGEEFMSRGFLSEGRKLEFDEMRRSKEKEFEEKLELIKNPPQYVSRRLSKSPDCILRLNNNTIPISKNAFTPSHFHTINEETNVSVKNPPDIIRVYHRLSRKRCNNNRILNESSHQHIAEKESTKPLLNLEDSILKPRNHIFKYIEKLEKIEMTNLQKRNEKSALKSPKSYSEESAVLLNSSSSSLYDKPRTASLDESNLLLNSSSSSLYNKSKIVSSEESNSLIDSSSSSLCDKIFNQSTTSNSKISTPFTEKSQIPNCLKEIAPTIQPSLNVEQNEINVIENKNTDIQYQSENSSSDKLQITENITYSSKVYMKNIDTPFEKMDGYDICLNKNTIEDITQQPIEINAVSHSTPIDESLLQKSNESSTSISQLKNTNSSGNTISDSDDPDLDISEVESVAECDYNKYYLTKTSLQTTLNKIKIKFPSEKGIEFTPANVISNNLTYKITEDPSLNFDKYMNNDDNENKLKYPPIMSNTNSAIFDNNDNDLLKQICTPKLMLHSKIKLPNRWLDINNTTFTRIVRDNSKKINIKSPKSSQTATWPIIMRGLDTLIVGSKGSGKTMGFLLPLCSIISNIDNLESLPKKRGPLAWIVCSDSKNAMIAERICNKLLKGVNNENEVISVVRIDTSLDDCTNACQLYAGCTILISLPYAVKLAELEVPALYLKRLLYLVFDNVDAMAEIYYTDVIKIHKMCTEEAAGRSVKGIQVIATSSTWNDLMVDLFESLSNPAICINAFKECILYSNIEIATAFTNRCNKTEELIKYLNSLEEKFRKIIIICDSDDDVKVIYDELKLHKFHTIQAFSSMNLDEIFNTKNQWENHTNFLHKLFLVCCDANLNFLNISDANCLIHFALPKSFYVFENRFSTFIDNLPLLWEENDNVICKVLLFITELDQLQLPKIVKFSKRCGLDFDEDVNKMNEDLLMLKEIDSASSAIPICSQLMRFGKCFNHSNCIKRHRIVPAFDKFKDWLPQSGYINFKIIRIHDVCFYSARILSYLNPDGTKVNIEQNYLKLAIDIATYYSEKKNRIVQTELKPGIICIAQINHNRFFRCQIVKNLPSIKGKLAQVLINLIDESNYVVCETSNLFEITEDIKNVNSTTIDICIGGLMPKDKDTMWSDTSKKSIADLFSKLPDNMFLRGRIVLSIRSMFWLDNVQCCQPMSSSNKVLVRVNMKKFIIDSGIGVVNPQHIPLLNELFKKASWYIPKYDVIEKVKKKEEIMLPKPSWAFLEKDIFSEVYFSCGVSPSVFFVHVAKWRSCLNMLQKDIQKYADELQKSVIPSQPAEFTKGQYCIVKHTDNVFYRCRIDNINRTDDSEIWYDCFFVDYGDVECVRHNNVYPINAQLITQMPFQAVECRLLGLEKYSDTAIDLLYDMCFESENSDILKIILAKYCLVEKPVLTKGNKYVVCMFDPSLEDKQPFHEIFVLKMLGKALESEMPLVDIVERDMEDHIQYCLVDKNYDEFETDIDDFTEPGNTLAKPENALMTMNKSEITRFNRYDISSISDFEIEEEVEDEWDVTFNIIDYFTLKNQEENKKKEEAKSEQKIVEIFDDDVDASKIEELKIKSNQPTTKPDNTEKAPAVIEMSSHKTPFVRWYETKTEVFLKIELVGVELYDIVITISAINFECVLRDTEYKLNIDLVGGVAVDKCTHEPKGLYISIKLVKLIGRIWSGLIKNVEKAPWLKPDYDICEISDNEEDMEPDPLDMRKQTLEKLTKADFDENFSDDEEDDDDREIAELLNDLN